MSNNPAQERFFDLLDDVRAVCDKIEEKHGRDECWQMLFKAYSNAILVPASSPSAEQLASIVATAKQIEKELNDKRL